MTRVDDIRTLTSLLPDLRRLARILAPTPEAAEDLVQETCLQVLDRLERGADIDALRPYAMTTLRNASRRRAGLPVVPLEAATLPPAPDDAQSHLICAEVLQAIARLPRDQTELMCEWLSGSESYGELARRLDLPLGTLTSRLARARARLRTEFDLPDGGAVQALIEGPRMGSL